MKIFELLTTRGVHEKYIRERFKDKACFDLSQPVFSNPLILLAFSNRSGSNLLGQYLRSAGFKGFREQLNYPGILRTTERENLTSFPDYIKFIAKGDKPFGTKASTDQLAMILRLNIANMFNGLKVIHIIRTDSIQQAISYSIADQTKQWTSEQQALPGVEPQFHYEDIAKRTNNALINRASVPFLCKVFNLPYLGIFYEGLIADPYAVMQKIGNFLDHDLSDWEAPQKTILKQSNQLNQQFKRQFLDTLREKILKA